ncbi:MAG TPA: Fe-S cluster assembly protein IscX [Alphaproteobacteria bacterium]|nr:Fe-S cluster assembly protein IscX [Alphaproteobacteria bacterium]MDP6271062.1 Fe-S cluster assembly protein IscX [Alphaproteobacteria bacterium]HJM50967.1 Fe-S cluster assembly protein IscX [Alphaproteobacteria bacterium]
MKWADVRDIAIALEDTYPEVEILGVRFTDLHRWVCELPDFADDPEASSEKTLEAIQMTWLDERDD